MPLRELWPHEAHDFTVWLCDNLDVLFDRTGLELTLVERNAAAGPFAADILADAGDGRLVVIENQLEATDHDHLGKLITYLSNLDAKIGIWISSDPRPEHERAIHFLNETLPADSGIYLLRVEGVRIGEAPVAAPLFTVVAGPSAVSKAAGAQKVELAERHLLRKEFWQSLQERAKGRTSLHAAISPGYDNWLSASLGGGWVASYIIRMDAGRVEFHIDRSSAEETKRIFDALAARSAQIENVFGAPLEWHRQDNTRRSRISYALPSTALADRERWPQLQEQMIDAMIRLHHALLPEIRQFNAR